MENGTVSSMSAECRWSNFKYAMKRFFCADGFALKKAVLAEGLGAVLPVPRMPLAVSIELSNRSGKKHCLAPNRFLLRREGDMSEALFHRIIHQCRRQKISMIRFAGGGDPLSHPWALQLISHTVKKGFAVMVRTGGLSGDQEFYRKLVQTGARHIRFTLEDFTSSSVDDPEIAGYLHSISDNMKSVLEHRQKGQLITLHVVHTGKKENAKLLDALPHADAVFYTGLPPAARNGSRLVPWGTVGQFVPWSWEKKPRWNMEIHWDGMVPIMVGGTEDSPDFYIGNCNRTPISRIWRRDILYHVRQLHLAKAGRHLYHI